MPPKRRKPKRPHPFRHRSTSGFEALVPVDGREDFFFSEWLSDEQSAAQFLEGAAEVRIDTGTEPRFGIAFSFALHVIVLILLFVDPNFDFLGSRVEQPEQVAEIDKTEPLVMFFEQPQPELPPAVQVVPVPPPDAPPPQPQPQAAPPPQVADNGLIIPKAMIAPPPDQETNFRNDLPFSEGNTEEFYTDEEVKDPGDEGKEGEEIEPEEVNPGSEEKFAEEVEGADDGNDGVQVADEPMSSRELGDFLFGESRFKPESRPSSRAATPRTDSRARVSGDNGQDGENGAFTDIRRFLADARFHNPDGGLISNTNNTMYYNDQGANFVPWISRMIAEIKRNWKAPYSVSFNAGHVAIGISVDRAGNVVSRNMLIPSGVSGFDNAADGAIQAARLLPLPADYPDDRFDIILVFWYNEVPYDIFG